MEEEGASTKITGRKTRWQIVSPVGFIEALDCTVTEN